MARTIYAELALFQRRMTAFTTALQRIKALTLTESQDAYNVAMRALLNDLEMSK